MVYPKTREIIGKAMKVVQREFEDSRLKVVFLTTLLDLREKLDKNGKENQESSTD